MSDFILSCCSTADMPKSFFEERNVAYVCFHFNMDGKDYPDDLGESMPFPEFYKRIEEGAQPTTSQVNVDEFTNFFEPFLKEGKDILHVSLSSGLSGSFNSASIAARDLMEKYPERTIKVVDSLGASSGFGVLMTYLADLRDEGKSLTEVYDWAEKNKLRVHHWFFSTDLTSYKRGGRISATSAMVGTLLGICPLLNMDNEGHLIPRKKIRTKKKVIEELVNMMKEHVEDGPDYKGYCYISNSACEEDAEKVRDLVEAYCPNLKGKVLINSIGTVIGSHTGPGTVALFFLGDERVD
ncbi:MAG: DegV family protein [Lachnospiraceae bacterium]|nr:DegV family protein [Lachnospiraceae bacterium]MCI5881159.1 DegV family protein [Clostridium sp.]CDA68365.1 degV family EDD domain-containing protein [Clostridium sp. CAG:510]MDD6180414.1 DegV family protein [Clostridium sp.]MDY4820894.1 DegV family protein [Lachnospiraceae bacterium]